MSDPRSPRPSGRLQGDLRSVAALPELRRQPLQQLWRDHLLSGAFRRVDAFEDSQFVVLYPKENAACRRAIDGYRATLTDATSFDTWLLEDVLAFLAAHTSNPWPSQVFDRYCDFAKLDRLLLPEGPA